MQMHVAGPPIQVDSWLRQRCSWCGAVIINQNLELTAVPVEPDGSAASYPTWEMGAVVAIDGGLSYVVAAPTEEFRMDDYQACCISLDPEVTV